jgi:hypothetical protein
MRRRRLLTLFRVLVPLGCVLAIASSAWAGVGDRAGNTFAFMVDEIVKDFQPVEGVVVQLEGDTIYLDLGSAQARVGQELTIFRKGAPFVHPFTGKPIGRYEEVLGHAQIRRVLPKFSEGLFIPAAGKPRPEPDDGVRITRGRIRMAVTPVLDLTGSHADLRRVPYLLATTLERTKRFQVLDPLTASEGLVNASVRVEELLGRPARALVAGRSLEVSGWLVPTLIERNGVTYLDVTWISGVTGTALFSRRERLVPGGVAEEQRFPWEPKAED